MPSSMSLRYTFRWSLEELGCQADLAFSVCVLCVLVLFSVVGAQANVGQIPTLNLGITENRLHSEISKCTFVGSALGCWVKEGWDWLIMFLSDALLK